MPQRLNTSSTHKLLLSPVGLLIQKMKFERVKAATLQREFRIGRMSAAAMATIGGSVDEFLDEVGVTEPLPDNVRFQIEFALEEYALLWAEREEVNDRWEEAFWSGKWDYSFNDQLVALEDERRLKSERVVRPHDLFGFLANQIFIPTVKYAVPTPDEVFSEYSALLHDPDSIYTEPPDMPPVEVSSRVLGPSGYEYFIRFPSPSPFTRDTVYARVYEPEDMQHAMPTFIYSSGLAMLYDQISYWPEEEYMGRFLSARGCRVILLESPWHGRRTPPGYYSGEYYIAAAPVSQFQLYSAQVQEIAILIKLAHSLGSSAVGVGGVSMGGIVTEHVAGRCGAWSEDARPELVFLGASCDHVDEVAVRTELNKSYGLIDALRQKDWRDDDLKLLHMLLDPPPVPAVAPDRIITVLGRRDKVIPYEMSLNMLRRWKVPDENIVVWNTGHFGVLLNLTRGSRIQNIILQKLHRYIR